MAKLDSEEEARFPQFTNEAVKFDITMDQHSGLKCVDVVKQYLKSSEIIEPLILVLKQFLKANELNDPWKGGLSSYGLFLMIVSFL